MKKSTKLRIISIILLLPIILMFVLDLWFNFPRAVKIISYVIIFLIEVFLSYKIKNAIAEEKGQGGDTGKTDNNNQQFDDFNV